VQRDIQKRWAIAAGVVVCWLVLLAYMGSVIDATVLVAALAGLGYAAVRGLRVLNAGPRDDREELPDRAEWTAQRVWHAGQEDPTMMVPRPVAGFGAPTVMEQAIPPRLRLVTGDSVAETRTSGARAGRGTVELRLPEVPTVSREHAKFICPNGQWRVANLGINGLMVNGSAVAGECPLYDGDSIRWGTRPDALLSRVQIG
jgi:hypothetical protein